MRSAIEDVAEFHRKFGQPVLDVPTQPTFSRGRLRKWMTEEEQEELCDALAEVTGGHPGSPHVKYHMEKVADGLADLIYVCIGTALELGIPLDRVWAEVHRSNMTKEADPNGGKVRKGVDYVPPDIAGALWGKR